MKRLWILLLLLAVFAVPARAEMDGDVVYTLYDGQGNELTMRAGRMFVGDEYISGDDRLYRVASVDDAQKTARAEYIGPATLDEAAATAFASLIAAAEPEKKIAMYSTHSDESYVPSDGESSKLENAGIYDVGEALAKSFESLAGDGTARLRAWLELLRGHGLEPVDADQNRLVVTTENRGRYANGVAVPDGAEAAIVCHPWTFDGSVCCTGFLELPPESAT